MNNKSLTLDGLNIKNSINLLLSLAVIGVSIYLTKHFYDVHFPAGLGQADGLCDINSFFTCSGATHSAFSNILGVPVAFFGLVVGLALSFGVIFPSVEMERTNKFIISLNLPGIIILFLYSLISLGSLCPMCTVYYALTGTLAFLYLKYGVDGFNPSLKILGIWFGLTLIGSAVLANHYTEKKTRFAQINQAVIEQFKKLENLGEPIESPYKITDQKIDHLNAPIRISIFSDFECPFCGVIAKQTEEIIKNKKYAGRLSVQYFFYPLDNLCNANMKRSFHQYACKAAYVAACSTEHFLSIHDEIFHHQKELNDTFLAQLESKYGLKDCYQNQAAKDFVVKSIEQGDQFKVQSTPTMIINGRKIEGSVPTPQLYAIFEYLLEQANQ
jgi:predicted DsbA family dithiol-disulfide isomerase/uncharacterized membrane protein